jgi:hypothetical protein
LDIFPEPAPSLKKQIKSNRIPNKKCVLFSYSSPFFSFYFLAF